MDKNTARHVTFVEYATPDVDDGTLVASDPSDAAPDGDQRPPSPARGRGKLADAARLPRQQRRHGVETSDPSQDKPAGRNDTGVTVTTVDDCPGMGEHTFDSTTGGGRWGREKRTGWADLNDPRAVLAKQIVNAAQPRTAGESRVARHYCFDYLAHLRITGREPSIDLADLFSDSRLAAYKKHLAAAGKKRGTVNAIMSHVRRLKPGLGGFPKTRARRDGHSGRRPAGPKPTVMPALPAGVAQEIDGYRPDPDLLDPAKVEPVADTVKNAVRALRPRTPREARDFLRDAYWLAAWTYDRYGFTFADQIFTAANIEEFLPYVNVSRCRSVGKWAASLHALRDGLRLPLDVQRAEWGGVEGKPPYTDDEIAHFYNRAAQMPTSARRRSLKCVLDLVLGAGLSPAVLGYATPGWIHEDPDLGVVVRVDVPGTAIDRADDSRIALAETLNIARPQPAVRRRRVVPVLESYADAVLADRAEAVTHNDRWLLSGDGHRRAHRHARLVAGGADGRYHLGYEWVRARNRWLVDAANTNQYTAAELVVAAGFQSFQPLDLIYDHIVTDPGLADLEAQAS
ncbi:MAG TPA: hypothetical protein VFP54_06010 [Acidimicrobiales bacterium]|nr:hypothetical protein [Acidimicrobiales bacterium]